MLCRYLHDRAERLAWHGWRQAYDKGILVCMQVAQYLIQQGASINADDARGRTPLTDAVMGGHSLMSQLLKFNGANLGHKILVRAASWTPQMSIVVCQVVEA